MTAFAVCLTAHAVELPAYTEMPESEIPAVDGGTARRFIVKSKCLGADVIVDVWVPDIYKTENKAFPVLYVHDGQNLFDPELSFSKVAWELDRHAGRLSGEGAIEAPVIVGMHNRVACRPNDYFPEKALGYIAEGDLGKTEIHRTCNTGFSGDKEAAFVATELKPLVDHLYRTNPAPSHTFVMGSSMGALASLYLMCEYPDVFGGAACLSTHWIGSLSINDDFTMNDDPVCARAILDYMEASLPADGKHRIYFDRGTLDWDAVYGRYETDARDIARKNGYLEADGTLMTFDAVGARHNEWYWQQRVERPLVYLLSPASLSGVRDPREGN